MDTIDVSNLNRQFLFRPKDVGRPKAEVAAEFLNSRIPNCAVVPHYKKIQDLDESFYRRKLSCPIMKIAIPVLPKFHIIVCGLDSIIARRWINGMLISLLNYEDGVIDPSSIIPLIDGGTEGFKGNARVIIPGMTACIECTLELYPPQEIKVLKEDLATRLNSNETAELLKEKDEQIKGLLEEGEKLSKQQLQNSNIIKKLRAKEKERENTNTKQNKKIKELEDELQHLKQVLDGKEEIEKQHRENIKQLNSVVECQVKDLRRLQVDLEDLEEKNRSAQAALDNAYKELADLHKTNAAKDCEAQEAALSHEIKVKEELGLILEKAQEEAYQQQEALAIQVTDLRIALQRAEQQAARKEDYLRQEISDLQQRLQEAETRNQELSQSVTSATRPLLRQIENLQATLGAQTLSWEKLEKNLSERLGESQAALAAQTERERAATEELLSNKIQLSSTESQNSLLRQENSRLQAQLEAEKSRLKKLENENNRYEVELENLKEEYVKVVEGAKKEKMLLSTQLEMEKMKVEQEKKKTIFVQESAREKERKLYISSTMETLSSTPTLSRSSSISGVDMAGLQTSFICQDDQYDHSFGSVSASGTNLYDVMRMGAGSSIIENLQSQLKLRDGEISHLQLEIGNLERTRSVMAEELVKLTNQNDDLEEKIKEIPKLRAQLRDLDQRYNTILQMYGEKAEAAEELRLDLEDVKNMYKTQIDELLKQRHS
ncbi:PREDICTED: TATA element modulatory factor [Thamnophis sirtalis]|uniref:TATA element modulatory factor n=1 Tax=Thamnophis sirtalis TaxID=35019 RepID=A0A6I9YUZ7_9SAUR|nr:PREDICTED: TATA element modulatory factor [Thamnophis sirtalis]